MLQSLNIFSNSLKDIQIAELLTAFVRPTTTFDGGGGGGQDQSSFGGYSSASSSITGAGDNTNSHHPHQHHQRRNNTNKEDITWKMKQGRTLVMNNYFESNHFNQSVTSLSIGRNELGPLASDVLTRMMKQNVTLTTLSLDGVTKTTPVLFKGIIEAIRLYNPYLQSLNLDHWTNLSVKSCEYVAKLLRCPVKAHQQFINIHTLSLQKCSLTFLHLKLMRKFLALSHGLKSLDLSFNPITDQGADYLADILMGKEMGDEEKEELEQQKREKEELKKKNRRASMVEGEESLEIIDEEERAEREAARHRSVLPPIVEIINESGGPPIIYLSLSSCELTVKGITTITRALHTNNNKENIQRTVKELNFSFNNISSDCLLFMVELSHFSCEELNLSSTRLQTKGTKYLFQILTPSIYQIKANNMSPPVKTAGVLRDSLCVLSLSENEISDSVGKPFCEFLSGNQKLRMLDLSFNKLSDANKELYQQAIKVTSSSSELKKLEELFIRLEGNPCDPLILDAPGATRCKTRFAEGIFPNRFNSNNGGYDHVDFYSRATFSVRKEIHGLVVG
jgi:hypothetical protein